MPEIDEDIREVTAMPDTLAVLNKSEIDQQIATAHAYPRSITKFLNEARELVTMTEDIASSCMYALPRGGKTIEGPSARFAEIIASSWGNCRAGARVMSDVGDFVTAQGVFHDLERNVAITYEVRRRITDKDNKRFKADMIGVTANAACSIALRNAVLKGVPKAFWDDLYQGARHCAMGDVQTLANRRSQALTLFQGYGVTVEQIVHTLGIDGVDDIGMPELLTLRGIATAIKDGDTTPEQVFATKEEKSASDLKEPQRKSAKAKDKKPKEDPVSEKEKPPEEEPAPEEGLLSALTPGENTVLTAALEKSEASKKEFLEHFKIKEQEELYSKNLEAAMAWLKNPGPE